MTWITDLELVVGVILGVALACIVLVFLRRRWLSQGNSVFDCELRLVGDGKASRWANGIARYEGNTLAWYRIFSLSFRPGYELLRDGARIIGQRSPDPAEAMSLFGDHLVLMLRGTATSGRSGVWELSMTTESATGLLSWLEAAPPGAVSYLDKA